MLSISLSATLILRWFYGPHTIGREFVLLGSTQKQSKQKSFCFGGAKEFLWVFVSNELNWTEFASKLEQQQNCVPLPKSAHGGMQFVCSTSSTYSLCLTTITIVLQSRSDYNAAHFRAIVWAENFGIQPWRNLASCSLFEAHIKKNLHLEKL